MTPEADQQPVSARTHILALPGQMVSALHHLWSSTVNETAIELLAPRPGEHIVDLGFGFGPATIGLADRVGSSGRVTAVDPSRIMRLILGARCFRDRRRQAIEIRAGSGESLPVQSRTVDAVLGLNVMHHLDHLEQTTVELARVLRPGGRLLLIDEDFAHPDHGFHNAAGGHNDAFEPVDPDEVAALLTEAGLTDTVARTDAVGGQPAQIVTATRAVS